MKKLLHHTLLELIAISECGGHQIVRQEQESWTHADSQIAPIRQDIDMSGLENLFCISYGCYLIKRKIYRSSSGASISKGSQSAEEPLLVPGMPWRIRYEHTCVHRNQ